MPLIVGWREAKSRSLTRVLLLVLAVLVVTLFVWVQPQRQAAGISGGPTRLGAINDARRTNTQIVVAVFLVLGTWLTWQNFVALKEGKIAERLAKALEALGADSHATRIGALLALELVAKEAPSQHQGIVDAIAAYIRQHCQFVLVRNVPYESICALNNRRDIDLQSPDLYAKHPAVTPDVQVALDVLRRRNYERDVRPINLSGVHLRRADLSGIHLENAKLIESTVECSDITGAHFERVTATDSFFDGCSGAAHFEGASIHHASFLEAEISGSHFDGARMWGCNLWDTELKKTGFSGASMDGAKASGALFHDADFAGADLSHADLRHARGLTVEQLRAARITDTTTLPSALAAVLQTGGPPTS